MTDTAQELNTSSKSKYFQNENKILYIAESTNKQTMQEVHAFLL